MTTLQPNTALPARQRILVTAHELFYRDGIRATGIDRVIAESGVTKVTFYRHFPSKNDLVLAYLEHRHRLWMDWLSEALDRHALPSGSTLTSRLIGAFKEWFESESYRGCAFINAVVELEASVPEVARIAIRHKNELIELIAGQLPPTPERHERALAIAVALDGAIVRAQMEQTPASALLALNILLPTILQEAV
ncbi:MAG: TetR/AcrR family transcriptional regulator [Halothiobacillaceae bacterium]|jgi:AcrR family transcriptional regulator|nr:TetR/AcrR family transcriptional regulator [Halothiobacillaceae bacterium]